MSKVSARDLDLNLLRIFVVVAEAGSVTAAAARLYLTQPAISAALRRLSGAVGAPLFARQGRGITLTERGQSLLTAARPHLTALIAAALSPAEFDVRRSQRTIRLGLSDSNEEWLLPRLVRVLGQAAPQMSIIVHAVQFRTVAEAFTRGTIDLAVTVADDLPSGIGRRTLFVGGMVCVYDPRHTAFGDKLTRARYLAHDHVIVSYNGDLRGAVEDAFGVRRKVRVSVPTFHAVGALVDGSALLATVPLMIARELIAQRPTLRIAPLPFPPVSGKMELLFRTALDDDKGMRFVVEQVTTIAQTAFGAAIT